MKVSILNKWDITGGAARAAYRLYKGLTEKGVQVGYLVQEKKSNESNIHRVESFDKSRRFLQGQTQRYYISTNRTALSNTYFSFSYSDFNLSEHSCLTECDIINLHWIEQFVSPLTLNKLAALNKPMVWTLHDQRAFTGGCHYTAGCTGFISDCSECLQLRYDPFRLAQRTLEAKLLALKDADLTIVTPSRWLADEVRRSRLLRNHRIEVVPNSLETDIFTATPKTQAKEKLGIDGNTITLMFGAQDNKERRKGLPELVKALRHCLQNPRFAQDCKKGYIQAIVVGNRGKEIEQLPIQSILFGQVEDDRKMSEIYSATEVFILPSLEDNLPNMMLESMSCGTPVIGFNTGGIPDVVKQDMNGMLVDKESPEALADAILELVFDESKRRRFGHNSRILMETDFSLENQASHYLSLFEDLLKNKRAKKKNLKKMTEEMDELFDPAIGFSMREALFSGNNMIRSQLKNQHNDHYIKIIEEVNRFHQTSILRKPVTKFRALRNLVRLILFHPKRNTKSQQKTGE